jgi:Domain of unknown function (DUF4192)
VAAHRPLTGSPGVTGCLTAVPGCAVPGCWRHSAFCAWQSGNGALGNVALDRALADNPRYSMALLLRDALDSGVPPSMARLPMTPEEVAASYDAAEVAPPGRPSAVPAGEAGPK